MAKIIDDETIENVCILAKLSLSDEAKEKAKEERKTAETLAEGKSRSIDSVSKQKAEKAAPKEKSSDVSEGREKTKEKDSGDDKNSKDEKTIDFKYT